jgi:tetratricopeptide (TPR) repeat protein
MAGFFLPLALAGWLILGAGANSRDTLRYGPLLIQHGLGLAALLALWGAIRHRQAVAGQVSPVRARQWRLAVPPLAALGLVGGLIALFATVAPGRLEKKSPPIDEATRQHAIESRKSEIATRFKQGVDMMQMRQYTHAVTAFHRVLALDPTLPEAHVNMGFALLETGDPAGAQRFFESATRLNTNQLNAYYGLALAAQAQGAHQVAAGAMRTWLHLAPPDDPFRPRGEAIFDAAVAAARQQREVSAPTTGTSPSIAAPAPGNLQKN